MEAQVNKVVSALLSSRASNVAAETSSQALVALGNLVKRQEASQDSGEALRPLVSQLPTLIPVLLAISSPNPNAPSSKGVQLSLRTLGYLLHNPALAKHLSESLCQETLSHLTGIVTATKDKSMCNLALWCLAVQQLPLGQEQVLSELLPCLAQLLHPEHPRMPSSTIQMEAIHVLSRLLYQTADSMRRHALTWLPSFYYHLFSDQPNIREAAELCMKVAVPVLLSNEGKAATAVSRRVFTDLNGGLVLKFDKFLEDEHDAKTTNNNSKTVFALRVWSYFVLLLGKQLFNQSLIKALLQIPSVTFNHPNPVVRASTWNAWRSLIDNTGQDLNVLVNSNSRISLIMKPFLKSIASEENKRVRMSCFRTWTHLLGLLGSSLDSVYDRVVLPVLNLFLQCTDPSFRITLCHFVAEMIVSTDDISAMESDDSVIMTEENEESKKEKKKQVKRAYLSNSAFVFSQMDYLLNEVYLSFLRLVDYNSTAEQMVWKLWESMLKRITNVLAMDDDAIVDDCDLVRKAVRQTTSFVVTLLHNLASSSSSSHQFANPLKLLCRLFASLQSILPTSIFISSDYTPLSSSSSPSSTSAASPLKHVLDSCPSTLDERCALVSFFRATLSLSSSSSAPLSIFSKGNHSYYNRLLQLLFQMTPSHGQLPLIVTIQHVLLKQENGVTQVVLNQRNALIWLTVASMLKQYMDGSNSNTDSQVDPWSHSHNTAMLTLLFPLSLHSLTSTQEAALTEANENNKKEKSSRLYEEVFVAWRSLFKCFYRIALLRNEHTACVDLFSSHALLLLDSSSSSPSSWFDGDMLGRCLCTIVEFSKDDATELPLCDKRHTKPSSFFMLLNAIVCQECQRLASANRLSERPITRKVLEALTLALECINSKAELECLLHGSSLLYTITSWLQHQNVVSCSTHLKTSVDSLWDAFLICLKSNVPASHFDTPFLLLLYQPLAEALGSKRRHIKNSSLTFWNDTFGVRKELVYPNEISAVLRNLRGKVHLNLPNGWQKSAQMQQAEEKDDDNREIMSTMDSSIQPKGRQVKGKNKKVKEDEDEEDVDDEMPSMHIPSQMFPSVSTAKPRYISKLKEDAAKNTKKMETGKSSTGTKRLAKRKRTTEQDSKQNSSSSSAAAGAASVSSDDEELNVKDEASPTKKKRKEEACSLLTEHQREVLERQRKTSTVVLYNNLDQSLSCQDASFTPALCPSSSLLLADDKEEEKAEAEIEPDANEEEELELIHDCEEEKEEKEEKEEEEEEEEEEEQEEEEKEKEKANDKASTQMEAMVRQLMTIGGALSSSVTSRAVSHTQLCNEWQATLLQMPVQDLIAMQQALMGMLGDLTKQLHSRMQP
ncbi:sodium/potassium/calcium exchanger 1 isoform X4 [Balamuthia mandrillaris]